MTSYSTPANTLNVREFRGRIAFSQREMAAYLRINKSSVSRMETGFIPISGPIMKLLEQLLEAEQNGTVENHRPSAPKRRRAVAEEARA